MSYIKVAYLVKGQPGEIKTVDFPEHQIRGVYRRTIEKLTAEGKEALVAIYDDENILLDNKLIKL